MCGAALARDHASHSPHEENKMANTADRKSTRLNSSHSQISYAVFCLKKKKKTLQSHPTGTPRQLSSTHTPPSHLSFTQTNQSMITTAPPPTSTPIKYTRASFQITTEA